MGYLHVQSRDPSEREKRLLRALVAKAPGLHVGPGWFDELRVRPMDDGGMGSLELVSPRTPASTRRFGQQAAELEFTDRDGVLVVASLLLDQDGEPFELDLWKVDFSPLIELPDDAVADTVAS